MLLSPVKRNGLVFEYPVEVASEVALEAASGFSLRLALGDPFRDVGLRPLVAWARMPTA
jgi:hypothetical protein